MIHGAKAFFQRHPLVRDAALWAIPAVLFGLALRAFLLSYSPLAYWGSDSRSYFDFSFKFYVEHYLSLVEKRRLLYPIYVGLVTLLPGTPLRWIALLQHGLGLLTLLPVAYIIRKSCSGWRFWIIPITVLYAGMPVLLWYEHELLGETVMFSMVAWAFSGWVAWVDESRRAHAMRLWWVFLLPFAIVILTKPSARFFWPGLLLGVLFLRGWKRVGLRGIIATIALMVATLFMGSKKQGAWLLYTATFPLTQLNSPKHAEYKAQIADKVREHRARLDYYYRADEWAFSFLENPSKQTERPLWTALERQPQVKFPLYMDLALEGIKAEPLAFLQLGRDRLVGSANVSSFKELRFTSGYYPARFEDDYNHALETVAKGKASYEALALGYPQQGPLPPFSEVVKRLAPSRDGAPEKTVVAWVAAFERCSDLVRWPAKKDHELVVAEARPTLLGWYLLVAMLTAFAPPYRRSFGVWVLAATSYLCGVFLVSQVNPRYFGAAWPILLPLLALHADLIYRAARGAILRSRGDANDHRPSVPDERATRVGARL